MRNEITKREEAPAMMNPLAMVGSAPGGNTLAAIMNNQAIVETMASIYIAKQFPRDLAQVTQRVNESCARPSLANIATYAYNRGGSTITGPSIRLAEVLSQAWGNIDSGWSRIGQHYDHNGMGGKGCPVAECKAWAWDKEANIRKEIAFDVPLIRETKQGDKVLTSERDIYEMCANMASRRVRACVLGVIPGWVVDEAMERVEKTLESGDGKPLADRVRSMKANFAELGVTKEMIESKLGHSVEETTRQELVALGREYNAIRDGIARVKEVFPAPEAPAMTAAKPKAATPVAKRAEQEVTAPAKDGELPIA